MGDNNKNLNDLDAPDGKRPQPDKDSKRSKKRSDWPTPFDQQEKQPDPWQTPDNERHPGPKPRPKRDPILGPDAAELYGPGYTGGVSPQREDIGLRDDRMAAIERGESPRRSPDIGSNPKDPNGGMKGALKSLDDGVDRGDRDTTRDLEIDRQERREERRTESKTWDPNLDGIPDKYIPPQAKGQPKVGWGNEGKKAGIYGKEDISLKGVTYGEETARLSNVSLKDSGVTLSGGRPMTEAKNIIPPELGLGKK